jgi:DNA-binding GntR family transcriptional regulator
MDNLAVRLAVHYGSNAEFLQMFDHAILCLEAAKAGDMVTRIKEDCAFHLELSVISKNQYLIDFQRRNYLRIEFLQSWRGGYLDIY